MQKMWISSKVQSVKSHPYAYAVSLLLFILIIIASVVVTQFIYVSPEEKMSKYHYVYDSFQADNDVILHVMQTKPQFIHLQSINNNVTESGFNGINGGFFWQEQLLSIAVVNDLPVQGVPMGYGSGWFNTKYARGTLVYDQITNEFSIQIVSSADEIIVTDHSQYWAQGGVSMNLDDDINWERVIGVESLPFPSDSRLRSGLVYDQEGFVYLIISSTHCTSSEFRSAILEQMHTNQLIDGIFLDGDGSSQMLTDALKLIGDGRKITQMIRVD